MSAERPDTAPILITGAARNIGAYMAWRFHEAGQPVIAHYRSETEHSRELAAAGVPLVQADFHDTGAVDDLAEAVRSQTGQLRAIIHNASAFAPTRTADADACAQFERFFNVHMQAPFLLNRALAGCLIGDADNPADIIHITDIYADNPATEYDIYCATKAGLQNLALSAAKRLAPEVKVNVIQPGPIDFQSWHDPEQRRKVLATTPLAQTGGPGAIFCAVRGILDNPFQTGAVIAVDGGRRLARH